MTAFRVVIPARYASQRLHAKVLQDLAGKPVLQHVYERSCKSGADSVVIATDDERILKVAETFCPDVCMTASTHVNATSRIAEVITKLNYQESDIIVNVQGDEPLIPPAIIAQVATNLATSEADMATLKALIDDIEMLFDPNVVKVVCDNKNTALYFTRAPIPWQRNAFASAKIQFTPGQHFRHIGLYAYRSSFVRNYANWDHAQIEQLECLEQLRALANGAKIQVDIAKELPPIGIDTEKDLTLLRKLYQQHSKI